MPDILIRGYSMPASCATCHFNNNMFCDVLGLKIKFPVDYIERPGACPLHELPPHGDLIDRNALMEIGSDLWVVYDDNGVDETFGFSNDVILNAPVIVPAEEGST